MKPTFVSRRPNYTNRAHIVNLPFDMENCTEAVPLILLMSQLIFLQTDSAVRVVFTPSESPSQTPSHSQATKPPQAGPISGARLRLHGAW